MARIFAALSVIALAALAGNLLLGLSIGDFQAAAQEVRAAHRQFAELDRRRDAPTADREAARARLAVANATFRPLRQRVTLHMLLGAAAGLVTVLVNSIAITYFVGTSRWCKEVVETYRLDGALAEASARIKRQSFPWSLVGIFTILAIIALGAAADPSGANHERSTWLVTPHFIAAAGGLAVLALAFAMQMAKIAANYAVIEQILEEVRRVRASRGIEAAELAS